MLTLPVFKYAIHERDFLPPHLANFKLPAEPCEGQLDPVLSSRDKILHRLKCFDTITTEHCKEDDAELTALIKRFFPKQIEKFESRPKSLN